MDQQKWQVAVLAAMIGGALTSLGFITALTYVETPTVAPTSIPESNTELISIPTPKEPCWGYTSSCKAMCKPTGVAWIHVDNNSCFADCYCK